MNVCRPINGKTIYVEEKRLCRKWENKHKSTRTQTHTQYLTKVANKYFEDITQYVQYKYILFSFFLYFVRPSFATVIFVAAAAAVTAIHLSISDHHHHLNKKPKNEPVIHACMYVCMRKMGSIVACVKAIGRNKRAHFTDKYRFCYDNGTQRLRSIYIYTFTIIYHAKHLFTGSYTKLR